MKSTAWPTTVLRFSLDEPSKIMRSDLLSKRLFFAGCFGLPWLWVVHVLYHRQGSTDNEDENDDEGTTTILNPDDRT
jgi:hypothetical protein